MYNCKSSPLINFERKHAFDRKMKRPLKRRVRIQASTQQFRMSNPFSKHSSDFKCIPSELSTLLIGLEFLTYSNVAELSYEGPKNFEQDLNLMKAAVRRQETSLEHVIDSIKRSSIRLQIDKPNEEADQKFSRFYDDDSKQLFPITEINDVSFSLDQQNNFVGFDSTDTQKPKNYCYTEGYLPAANRAECDSFFVQ